MSWTPDARTQDNPKKEGAQGAFGRAPDPPMDVPPMRGSADHDRLVREGGRDDLALGTMALEVHGSLGEAREHFIRAALAAVSTEDDDLLGRAVLGWNGLWVHEARGVVDAARVQTWRARALHRLPESSQTARRLAVRDAAEADYCDGSVARVQVVLAEARRSADPLVLGDALNLAHHCMLGPEHAEVRLSIADELLALGTTEGRRIDLLMGLVWRTVDLTLRGDPHADRAVSELESLAAEPAHQATLYLVAAFDVMRLIRSGRLDEAESAADACFARGQEVGDADALGWYGAHLCAIRWYQGRSAELVPLISELVASPTLASTNEAYLSALAVAAADAGDRDAAAFALRRLRGPGLGNLRSSSTWMVALLGSALAAYAVHDHDVALEVRELLTPYADLPVMASLGVSCFGSAHFPLALVALTLGDSDGGRIHLEAAVRHNQALGNLPATRMAANLLASLTTAAAGIPSSAVIDCTYDDRGWLVSMADRRARIADCLGMRYLAVLLASPGTEISATDLAGRPTESFAAQPVLDDRAIAAYRARLRQLQDEIAEASGDERRLDAAQREYDALVDELTRSRGLGRRSRSFVSSDERARTSVQKAIKRALARVQAADPVIADAIDKHLVTGLVCSYRR